MNSGIHRSYLYVPANRLDRVPKAYASAADAVVLDLEDAVPPSEKEEARRGAAEVLAHRPPKPTYVRINSVASGLAQRDVAAVASPYLAAVRLPKCETVADVRRVAEWLGTSGCEAGIQAMAESARGVENLTALASASPRLTRIGLGDNDLAADLGAAFDSPTMELAMARCVLAARSAGLAGPIQSVFPGLDGLRESSLRAKSMGFVGRFAVHPSQLPVINEVYTPDDEEVARARTVVDAAARTDAHAPVFVTDDGTPVAPPLVARAQVVLELARSFAEVMP